MQKKPFFKKYSSAPDIISVCTPGLFDNGKFLICRFAWGRTTGQKIGKNIREAPIKETGDLDGAKSHGGLLKMQKENHDLEILERADYYADVSS